MRTYTAEQRADAVALAASIGPLKAAKSLGLPVSTVTFWTHKPAASPIIAAVERSIAQRLSDAHSEALAAVMAGLRDPSAKLGDRAAALRVLGDQLALAQGRATTNVELQMHGGTEADLSEEERSSLRDYLDSIHGTIEAYEAAHRPRGEENTDVS